MTLLFLTRHGETDWNAEGRWQGHADTPLNARGREQAHALATRLEGIHLDAIYTSDLRRTRETAAIVAAARSLPVTELEELREVDVGEWSGLTTAEVAARWPERVRAREEGRLGWLEGESYEAMASRVVACLERIARDHAGEQLVYVGHGGTVRGVLAHACGLSYAEFRRSHPIVENCSLHRIALEDGRFRVVDG